MESLRFVLPVNPPFHLGYTAWALRRSDKNETDIWEEDRYRRILTLNVVPHLVVVRQVAPTQAPHLEVTVKAAKLAADAQSRVTPQLTRMLGLAVDLKPFYRHIRGDSAMRALTAPFVGMRPPRLATEYETLVAAVTCQQLSLAVGITLLNRLSHAFGHAITVEGTRVHAFPTAEQLADSEPSQLRRLGYSWQKAQTVIELSRGIANGSVRLDEFDGWDDEQVRRRLFTIKGIGAWTADYFLLRGLGRLHVFPRSDSGALNGLASWLKLRDKPGPKKLERILAPRQPYAGMIYFHLLLRKLAQQQSAS